MSASAQPLARIARGVALTSRKAGEVSGKFAAEKIP